MKTRLTRRYLAGLIDGEGYISIKPTYLRGRQLYSPVIKLALTDKSAYLLFEIKDLLGGYIYRRSYKKSSKWNDSYCWEVHNFTGVKKVLDYVYPYLILKKDQAKLVKQLITTKQTKRNKYGQFYKINPGILEIRETLYTSILKLNKRGRATASTEREAPTDNAEGEATVRTLQECKEINGIETLIHQN